MLSMVQSAKHAYTQGQSYKQFLSALGNPSPTIPETNVLFSKVFEYVSKNTPDADILVADNSTMISQYVNALLEDPKYQSPPYDPNVGGAIAERKWWQNLINAVVNVAVTIFVPQYNGPQIIIFQ
jgi:hypothetical protein